MPHTVISVENLSKSYRLGTISTGTFYGDLKRWWARQRGLPDPYLKIGEVDHSNRIGDMVWALNDINFTVRKGEALGIIGRNGAGKSTLLKILSQVTAPTSGVVKVKGKISSLLEVGTGFHPELTGRENIFLNGAIMGMSRAEVTQKIDEIVDFSGVEKFIDTPVKRYSSGMYVRLAFAVAAHLEPDIMVVDEVLSVGDINFRRKCMAKMDDVTHGGRTVLFVSHDLSAIRQLCARTLWIDKGLIHRNGPTDEVTREYEQVSLPQMAQNNGEFLREPVPNKNFYIERIELCTIDGELSANYNYGNDMEIRLHFCGEAYQDSFTVEWMLFNESGNRISFGAANPLHKTYLKRDTKAVSCILRRLPLTTGVYRFYFSVRVWGQERWDEWEHAAQFWITSCDPGDTGFDASSPSAGSFVIEQDWSVIHGERESQI